MCQGCDTSCSICQWHMAAVTYLLVVEERVCRVCCVSGLVDVTDMGYSMGICDTGHADTGHAAMLTQAMLTQAMLTQVMLTQATLTQVMLTNSQWHRCW